MTKVLSIIKATIVATLAANISQWTFLEFLSRARIKTSNEIVIGKSLTLVVGKEFLFSKLCVFFFLNFLALIGAICHPDSSLDL